jgi:hypothetical protein
MTREQKAIGTLGGVILIVMALFPPWLEMTIEPLKLDRERGRAFLLTPPVATGAPYIGVGLDWLVLVVQLLAVGLVRQQLCGSYANDRMKRVSDCQRD